MSEIDDLIHATEDRLRRDLDVDAGLDALRAATRDARDAGELVELSGKALRRRLRALEAAAERLKRLESQLGELAPQLPILAGEWPVRRQQIAERLDRDLESGVVLWLSDWLTAAGHARPDAMERLAHELRTRPQASILLDRTEAVRLGLEQRAWDVAAAGLEQVISGVDGLEGLRLDDPGRARLAALVARLWLVHGEAQRSPEGGSGVRDLTRHLDRVAQLGLPATAAGLGSRWHRVRGDLAEAERWLGRSDGEEATDLDLAAELIEKARRESRAATAEDVAAVAVAAVPLVAEVERKIFALLYPAPVELWIATAQRALDEQEMEVFDRAVETSLSLADWQDTTSRARVAELKVAAAESRGLPADDVVTELVDAGSNRLWSGAAELAMTHLEHARQLAPHHRTATLMLADALVSSTSALPLGAARPRLDRAVELVEGEVDPVEGLDREHAWGFATEAVARVALMQDVGPRADEQAWPALLAACRGLAHDLREASRWRTLADTLSTMRADDLALDVASYVAREVGNGPSERQLHAEKLANAGFPEEALSSLEPLEDFQDNQENDWTEAVRAFCILRLGDPVEAVRLLRAVQLDPGWAWATGTLVTSLLLTGRVPEVMSEVAALERHWAGRLEEREGVVSLGGVRLLQGRFREAEELCRPLPDRLDDSGYVVAAALLLQGQVKEARARFEQWLESAQRQQVAEWSVLTAPQLRVIAVHNKVPIQGLDDLDRVAGARLETLRWADYPAAGGVVGRFRAGAGDPIAARAVVMCDALLRLARGDATAAAAGLAGIEGDAMAGQLRRSLEELGDRVAVAADVDAEVDPAPAEAEPGEETGPTATQIVVLLEQGETDRARMLLEELVERDPESVAYALWLAAHEHYEAYDAIVELLFQRSGEPDGAAAVPVRDKLRRWVTPRLLLPPSRFVGHEDPVTTHLLFTHYIPTARVSTPDMPGVRVTTDEDLEPAGYTVMLGSQVVETQLLPPGCRFSGVGSEPLFGVEAGSWEEVVEGMVAVPDPPTAGLGALLSISDEELAVRRTEQVYRRWIAWLDEPESERPPGVVDPPTA